MSRSKDSPASSLTLCLSVMLVESVYIRILRTVAAFCLHCISFRSWTRACVAWHVNPTSHFPSPADLPSSEEPPRFSSPPATITTTTTTPSLSPPSSPSFASLFHRPTAPSTLHTLSRQDTYEKAKADGMAVRAQVSPPLAGLLSASPMTDLTGACSSRIQMSIFFTPREKMQAMLTVS